MDSGKNVTIYDIAKRAETSPSTVGAVMNGTWKARRISEARAEKIKQLADEMGYSVNLQASALRKERSKIIGMIVPMHDNRYFSSISQAFEEAARARGLFPIISSTLRDPKIEMDAVRLLLNYQVEQIVCTGATDPDEIAALCQKRGVKTYNLDLPGTQAPSIISNNHQGAKDLTEALIHRIGKSGASGRKLLFVGGRSWDHNTQERIRGFTDAARAAGIALVGDDVQPCGYAADKAEHVFRNHVQTSGLPDGVFVNSTISLEGVINWFRAEGMDKLNELAFGCFDWDPFAAMINPNIIMVRQDVDTMVNKLFEALDADTTDPAHRIEVPTVVVKNHP